MTEKNALDFVCLELLSRLTFNIIRMRRDYYIASFTRRARNEMSLFCYDIESSFGTLQTNMCNLTVLRMGGIYDRVRLQVALNSLC